MVAPVIVNERNALKCNCGGELHPAGSEPFFKRLDTEKKTFSTDPDRTVAVELFLHCSECRGVFWFEMAGQPSMGRLR